MTPLERLLAEELPTGTFGGARDRKTEPVPATVAAHHRQQLLAEVDAYDRAHRGQRPPRTGRHLQPVPDQRPAATTREQAA